MKYTVVWLPAAEGELANLWMASNDRESFARTADQIDIRLRRNPLQEGESREGDQRILIVTPLAVTYSVSQPDRLVQVLHVWTFT